MANKLSAKELNSKFISSIQDKIISYSDLGTRPLDIDLLPPLPSKIRLYIFTITSPTGGRTLGEHKMQLILPGQKRGMRGNFDESEDRFTILAGYEPSLEVFTMWDAGLYENFPFSRNVQVKGETIYSAFAGNIETQNRNLRGKRKETVIAAPSGKLSEALELRINKTLDRLLEED